MKSIHFIQRRCILLLEVLIAFALIVLCILPLIYPHVFILRSEKKFVATVELDHVVNLLYANILQKLYQNEIAWSDIENGTKIPIDASLLETVGYKQELPFEGSYHFTLLRQRPRSAADVTAYLFILEFAFTPKHARFFEKKTETDSDKIVYKYQVAVERSIK